MVLRFSGTNIFLSGVVAAVSASPDGRYSVIKLSLSSIEFLLFNVYFPCYENTQFYKDYIRLLTAFFEATNCYNDSLITLMTLLSLL